MTSLMLLLRNVRLPLSSLRIADGRMQVKHNYRYYGIYEPDYLEAMKPKIPLYLTLNIQLRGYDFPILENYQKYVNKIADYMDLDIEDGWATPAQKLKVDRYRPHSTVVDSQYELMIYERNIQVSSVESTRLPLLVQVLAATLPEGVKLQVHQHEPDHEEIRYVPDHELLALKSQLETISTTRK